MKTLFKSAALLCAAIIMALGVQSCNTVKPIDKSQLEGYWVLKTMNGSDVKTLFEGPMPSVEFNFADSMIAGNAGCNNYFGKFSLNDKNEFTAPRLGMTMMMCMHKNAEGDFGKTMSMPSVISIDENGLLTFTEKDKENVLFQFEKGEKPAPGPKHVVIASPESVAGKWTLKKMGDEDIAKLFSTKTPTMEFDMEKNRVFGTAGCNNYNATYKIENGIITFGPAMSTKMACPSLEGEGKFLNLLQTPVDASVNDGDLTFYKDGKIVLSFSKDTATE